MSPSGAGLVMEAVASALDMRTTFAQFVTGVAVVAYEDESGTHGLTVNSFTSISLDPPLLLISIQKSSRSHSGLVDKPFTVSVLAEGHTDVARSFASRTRGAAPAWARSTGNTLENASIPW